MYYWIAIAYAIITVCVALPICAWRLGKDFRSWRARIFFSPIAIIFAIVWPVMIILGIGWELLLWATEKEGHVDR